MCGWPGFLFMTTLLHSSPSGTMGRLPICDLIRMCTFAGSVPTRTGRAPSGPCRHAGIIPLSPHSTWSRSCTFNTECGAGGAAPCPLHPCQAHSSQGTWFSPRSLADKGCPVHPEEEGDVVCLQDQRMGFITRQAPFSVRLFHFGNLMGSPFT